jgi:hypothetical protein
LRKGKRPVVLVVDEAHDLYNKTLTGFKRLMEVVAGAGVTLSVLLVAIPSSATISGGRRWRRSAIGRPSSSSRA